MQITDISGTFPLHNGVSMPYLGLGVYQSKDGAEVIQAVKWALEAGYRHIDTAAIYFNEEGVGKGIRQSGIPREDIFVTSKVWNSEQGYESTLRAFDKSLHKLGFEYLDLYLIHWPGNDTTRNVATWRALEYLYQQGKVRAIGVSNFLQHHLEALLPEVEIAPMVDQLEFHPRLVQQNLQDFCKSHHIQYEAWSPIMRGQVLEIPELKRLGEKYGKSAVQIVLRWDLQKGVVSIPKSARQDRIFSNAAIFDFALTAEEMTLIDGLDQHRRTGPDPDTFGF